MINQDTYPYHLVSWNINRIVVDPRHIIYLDRQTLEKDHHFFVLVVLSS